LARHITPSPGILQERDENGIIVPVKWCGSVSLSTKAWWARSRDKTEKILDSPEEIEDAPNESPLRHQTLSSSCRDAPLDAHRRAGALCCPVLSASARRLRSV